MKKNLVSPVLFARIQKLPVFFARGDKRSVIPWCSSYIFALNSVKWTRGKWETDYYYYAKRKSKSINTKIFLKHIDITSWKQVLATHSTLNQRLCHFQTGPKSLILAVPKPRCLLESYWRLFPSSKAFLLRLVAMVTVFLEWGTRNNTHCHYCLEKLEETRFICPIQCLSNRIWTNKRWLTCFANWNEAIANSSIFNFIFPIC